MRPTLLVLAIALLISFMNTSYRLIDCTSDQSESLLNYILMVGSNHEATSQLFREDNKHSCTVSQVTSEGETFLHYRLLLKNLYSDSKKLCIVNATEVSVAEYNFDFDNDKGYDSCFDVIESAIQLSSQHDSVASLL